MTAPSWLAATLPVLDLALMSVAEVRRAAVGAGASGDIIDAPLDHEHIAGSFSSEKLFRLQGRPVDAFAPLSGFFRTSDGWVRTHGNYPHHATRLRSILGVADGESRDDVADAIAERSAQELEDAAAELGAICARVRTEGEWRASAEGRAAAEGALIAIRDREDVRPLSLTGGPRLLADVRVLDLTRVLAGPVCGRTLALFGADVLRIDPPEPAEIVWQHLDTGQGKRSTLLDLRTQRPTFDELLETADVLVTGYRPGAIESFGLELPSGIVHARVNAWGDSGPWARRRGFDSIVQAASGVAMIESADGDTPGALPAQALDHASGYLLAAGVIDALVARAGDGQGRDVHVSLARTATWLLDAPGRQPRHSAAATPTSSVTHGDVTTSRPAIPGFDDYPAPATPWGSDSALWRA